MAGWMEIGTIALCFVQGILMFIDEVFFHRKRKLGTFESWGHPVDSILFIIPLSVAALTNPHSESIAAYVFFSVISAVTITKDEWIHSAECQPQEHWVHAMLFIIHPSILWGVGHLWVHGEAPLLIRALPLAVAVYTTVQIAIALLFSRRPRPQVNNSFYDTLGSQWYEGDTHAVALLRVESHKKLQYVRETLKHSARQGKILDIGCGAGFIANPLSEDGFEIKGVDLSPASIEEAKKHAPAGKLVTYECQNAYALSEPDHAYDVVLMLDFLEHVDQPAKAIAEAARVLKDGGMLIVHTFNRNPLSALLAVYGIRLVTRDCPSHVHVYHLFLKPKELRAIAESKGFRFGEWRGIKPVLNSAFFWSLYHRRIHPQFRFDYSHSLAVGYLGHFTRTATPPAPASGRG